MSKRKASSTHHKKKSLKKVPSVTVISNNNNSYNTNSNSPFHYLKDQLQKRYWDKKKGLNTSQLFSDYHTARTFIPY